MTDHLPQKQSKILSIHAKNELEPRPVNSYLPQDWQAISLWEVCENPVSGYSPIGTDHPAREDEVGVLKLSCIKESRFHPEKNKSVVETKIDELITPVKGDTLIVSRSNTDELVGAVCYIERDYPNLFLSDLLWRVSAKEGTKIDLRWLSYLLSFAPYRAKIISRANGTSGSMKKITKSGFLGIRIVYPQLNEQRRIAEILSTWDTAINQSRKLIAAKKNRKKALMQQLLTGKKRLQGHKGSWKKLSLGELFSERNETNGDHLPLLAITGKRGIILASEIERKDSSSEDKSMYKRIAPGDIGYNTMRMWQGVSAVASMEGIVSPAYTICKPKKGVHVTFMAYLFKLPSVIHLFWSYSQGLVSDTLNLKFYNFAQIRIEVPDIKEQGCIADVLLAADDEIRFQEEKLSFLKKQKRGLMQKLLSGEVRVKV
ncbi:MAG: restriction endonuclease subunit S [Desulfatitalea sp.]